MDGKSLWLMDSDGKMVCKPKQITFNTNSIWAFDQALVHGYGIGVLPMCGLQYRDLGLVRILPEIVHVESLYLVAHQDLKRSMRIRAVFDYLVGAFKEDAAFFKGMNRSHYENEKIGTATSDNMLPPRLHQPKELPAAAE